MAKRSKYGKLLRFLVNFAESCEGFMQMLGFRGTHGAPTQCHMIIRNIRVAENGNVYCCSWVMVYGRSESVVCSMAFSSRTASAAIIMQR